MAKRKLWLELRNRTIALEFLNGLSVKDISLKYELSKTRVYVTLGHVRKRMSQAEQRRKWRDKKREQRHGNWQGILADADYMCELCGRVDNLGIHNHKGDRPVVVCYECHRSQPSHSNMPVQGINDSMYLQDIHDDMLRSKQ